MHIVALVGNFEETQSVVNALDDKKDNISRGGALSTFFIPPNSCMDVHARIARFEQIISTVPRSRSKKILFMGAIKTDTEAKALRAFGAVIWHVGPSDCVVYNPDTDFFIGKAKNGYTPLEALHESRARYKGERSSIKTNPSHPRSSLFGGAK